MTTIRTSRLHLLVALALQIGAAASEQSAVTRTLALRGEVVVEGYTADGSVQYSVTVPFEASVNSTLWWLRVDYDRRYSEECGCDGIETGCVLTFHGGQGNGTVAGRARPVGSFWPQVSIELGQHPSMAEATTRVIWFAYGSSGHFRRTNAIPRLPALWNGGFRNPASHAVGFRGLKLFDSPLTIPSVADFVVSRKLAQTIGELTGLSTAVPQQEINDVAMAAVAADGFPLASYVAGSVSNVDGLLVPTEFMLTVFAPGLEGMAFKQQVYRGRLDAIQNEERLDFLPTLSPPVSVRDYRFLNPKQGVQDLTYQCVSNVWPTVDSPGVVELIKRRKLGGARVVRDSPRTLTEWCGLALLVLACAALPLLIRRWRHLSG